MTHAPSDRYHCDDLDRLALDLLTAELVPADRAAVDAHLAICPRCRAEHDGLARTWEALGSLPTAEPSPALRQNVDQLIRAERAAMAANERPTPAVPAGSWWTSLAATLVPRQPAWQLAAGLALLAVGFGGGALASHRRATPELAALEGEIRSLRGLVSLTLLHQESASARLQGVSYGRSLSGGRGDADDVDPEVLRALLTTVTADPSANVRLAAVDALAAAAGEPLVRAALLDHLAADPSPLVQIGIVDLLLDHAPRAHAGAASRHELDRLLALARGPATDPNGLRDDADRLPPTVRDYLRQRLSTST